MRKFEKKGIERGTNIKSNENRRKYESNRKVERNEVCAQSNL